MGFNSPEWCIAFFGAVFNNNVVSGVYITNGPDACKYQAENSECQVAVVDTIEQLRIYKNIIDKLPKLKAVVCWGVDSLPEDLNKDFRFYSFKNFINLGKEVPEATINIKMDR